MDYKSASIIADFAKEYITPYEPIYGPLLFLLLTLGACGPAPPAIFLAYFMLYFPQDWWAHIVNELTYFQVVVVLLPLICFVTYWINGLFLLLLDFLFYPTQLKKFKIQKNTYLKKQTKKNVTNYLGLPIDSKSCFEYIIWSIFYHLASFICVISLENSKGL